MFLRFLFLCALNRTNDIKYDNPSPSAKVIPIDFIKKKLVKANNPNPIKLVKKEYSTGRIS